MNNLFSLNMFMVIIMYLFVYLYKFFVISIV